MGLLFVYSCHLCLSNASYTQQQQLYIGPDWSNNPAGLGQSQNFGAQVDRHGKKGSPVVPGSLELVMEDNDSALYTITVLKGMYEVSLIQEIFVLLDAHLRETGYL